jgi:hypothetical protein
MMVPVGVSPSGDQVGHVQPAAARHGLGLGPFCEDRVAHRRLGLARTLLREESDENEE